MIYILLHKFLTSAAGSRFCLFSSDKNVTVKSLIFALYIFQSAKLQLCEIAVFSVTY